QAKINGSKIFKIVRHRFSLLHAEVYSGWTIFTLLSTVDNPGNNDYNNRNNHITDFTENLLHQLLVFTKVKSDTGQKRGPDDGSECAIEQEFPEGHTAHAVRNADQ